VLAVAERKTLSRRDNSAAIRSSSSGFRFLEFEVVGLCELRLGAGEWDSSLFLFELSLGERDLVLIDKSVLQD